MKRLAIVVLFALLSANCFADSIATVGYVLSQILSEKGIALNVPTELTQIATPKYLMQQIDTANATLGRTTSYNVDVDTSGVVTADKATADIQTLIFVPEFNVELTGMTANSSFSFQMSATGTFVVDWGDGTAPQIITRTNTTQSTYVHSYAAAGNYTVSLAGDATGYSAASSSAAISFGNSANKTKMTGISGSLGAVFPTIGTGATDAQQPKFYRTFYTCTGLTGAIPTGLFTGISGAPVTNMFNSTFDRCTGLTGAIPAGLFAGINGAPAVNMFSQTFNGCTGLTGAIPAGLFGAFTGAPTQQMFYTTFNGCNKITTIEDGIWDLSGLSNTLASSMFYNTFSNMTSLTSAAPTIAAGNPTNLWEHFTVYTGQKAFGNNTNMVGIICMPIAWGGFGASTCDLSEFSVTLSDVNSFGFQISAKGVFVIDWGDGTTELFNRVSTTSNTLYSHSYAESGNYILKISGVTTGYSYGSAAISFDAYVNKIKITALSGGLGHLFPTIGTGATDAQQPSFEYTFRGLSGLTSLPNGLFDGISGIPMQSMFVGTFSSCVGLTSIPGDLFAGLSDTGNSTAPFVDTFSYCVSLTGSTPLINGQKVWYKLSQYINVYMFRGDTKLSDYADIPAGWK